MTDLTHLIERCESGVAKAIYEARNGHGCKPWSRLPKSHQEPYLSDARAAITAYQAEAWQGEETEFEVWQDDMVVAGASGPRDRAFAEAMHYAQVYGQDGPVAVCEVIRKPVPLPPAPKASP